jgi:hypothetical protein
LSAWPHTNLEKVIINVIVLTEALIKYLGVVQECLQRKKTYQINICQMSTKQRLGQRIRKAVFGATNNLTNNLKNGATNNLTNNLKNVKGQAKTKNSHE